MVSCLCSVLIIRLSRTSGSCNLAQKNQTCVYKHVTPINHKVNESSYIIFLLNTIKSKIKFQKK